MRAPDRYPRGEAWDHQPAKATVATPTVYPIDDEVREGLLGPDGKPLVEGKRRKHPIGFHKPRPTRPDPSLTEATPKKRQRR